jgi:5,10-methylenetetrahydromethanopterin reductase
MELWLHTFAVPGRVAATARWAEQAGFTGLLVADSQSLTSDVWIELTLAGAATSHLRVGPGATNPRTRHLSVTASASATLQAETGGRVVLGLARGDSALRSAGLQTPSVPEFERDLEQLQRLLSGELQWLARTDTPKVPLHVAATGPRVLTLAARHAEGVDLTVGADPARLRQAVAHVREAAGSPSIGAYLNVAVDEDRRRARDLVRGSTATFVRFQARELPARYDPRRHGASSSPLARSLDDELIDRFAIAGPPEEVTERLLAVADVGVERIIVVPGSLDSDPAALARSNERFAERVLAPLTAR